MTDNGSSQRQIGVPPHERLRMKRFDDGDGSAAMWILCMIIVLVIVLFTDLGNESRPTL